MNINWGAASAILGGLASATAIFLFVTKSVIREEFKTLEKIYLRKDVAEVKFSEIEGHFDYLRDHPTRARAHGAD